MEKKTSTKWEIKLSPLALKDLRTLDKATHKIYLVISIKGWKQQKTQDVLETLSQVISGIFGDIE